MVAVEESEAATSPSSSSSRRPLPETVGELSGVPQLRSFFDALARTEAGEAKTRVVHLGDSSIAMDQLPGFLRARLQERFGDGGPGFILLGEPTGNYRALRAQPRMVDPWSICPISQRCRRDGHYGLGGVAFRNNGRSETRWRSTEPVDHFEVWFAGVPNGGRLELTIGREEREVSAASPELEDRWSVHQVEGAQNFRVKSVGGRVRVYGIVLENEGANLVWDGLSLTGAYTGRLLQFDEEHIKRQVARRDPSLLVLSFGGNDLRHIARERITIPELGEQTRAVVQRLRAGKPEMACLVTGINDHLQSGVARIDYRHVEPVVDVQRLAAEAEGCAFFDVYAAMGGRGSFERWLSRGMAARDLKHLTRGGRRVIAERLADALLEAYAISQGRDESSN